MKWRRGGLGDEPDEHLPMLSVEGARRLEELVCAQLEGQGEVIEFCGEGEVRLASGGVLGLHNLAMGVSLSPRRAWAGIVSEHVLRVLASTQQEETWDLSQLLVKLRGVHVLPEPPSYPAREVLPGMYELIAVDHPTHVAELTELPGGLEYSRAREIALQNLRRLPPPERHDILADPERPDSVVHVLSGEDFFVAARICVLPELVASLGYELPDHGVLVCVPNRHLVAVHVLRGIGVLPALGVLGRIAREESGNVPGPLSDEVFYVSPTGAREIAAQFRDGQMIVEVRDSLAEAFAALGILGEEL